MFHNPSTETVDKEEFNRRDVAGAIHTDAIHIRIPMRLAGFDMTLALIEGSYSSKMSRRFLTISAFHEGDVDAVEHHIRTFYPVMCADTIRLASNLVIAGKTQGVDLVERATDPKEQQLRVFLDYVGKHSP